MYQLSDSHSSDLPKLCAYKIQDLILEASRVCEILAVLFKGAPASQLPLSFRGRHAAK